MSISTEIRTTEIKSTSNQDYARSRNVDSMMSLFSSSGSKIIRGENPCAKIIVSWMEIEWFILESSKCSNCDNGKKQIMFVVVGFILRSLDISVALYLAMIDRERIKHKPTVPLFPSWVRRLSDWLKIPSNPCLLSSRNMRPRENPCSC